MSQPKDIGLPDVTRMTLGELLNSDDPQIVAAVQRIVEQILSRAPGDAVEATDWSLLSNVTSTRRGRLISRWWSFWPGKPVGLQNGVSRVVCWFAGHEQGRSVYCDWCGKEMVVR